MSVCLRSYGTPPTWSKNLYVHFNHPKACATVHCFLGKLSGYATGSMFLSYALRSKCFLSGRAKRMPYFVCRYQSRLDAQVVRRHIRDAFNSLLTWSVQGTCHEFICTAQTSSWDSPTGRVYLSFCQRSCRYRGLYFGRWSNVVSASNARTRVAIIGRIGEDTLDATDLINRLWSCGTNALCFVMKEERTPCVITRQTGLSRINTRCY